MSAAIAIRWLLVLACALGLAACSESPLPARPGKVGIASLQLEDATRNRPLAVQLWYPAAANSIETPQAYERAFRGLAAPDAAYLDAGPRPLIVFSHGDRGGNTNQAWLAEALAGHGYIVASVEHYMNTRLQHTPEATLRAWDRPLDASYVISALLAHAIWRTRIDPARIGAAGHSSGGYTALALAGARYDPPLMGAYCLSPQAGPDCKLARAVNVVEFDWTGAAVAYRDARVGAAVALAPALGPGMTPSSLRAVPIPVLIAVTRDDEVLPFDQHAGRLAREIPGAALEALPEGGHFVFMPQCNWVGWVFTYTNNYDICGRRHDVDRAAIHEQLVRRVVQFFGTALRSPAAQ